MNRSDTICTPRHIEASTTLLSLHQVLCGQFEALLAFPADQSASRVRGNAVRAEMARLVGEGMLRWEAMKALLTGVALMALIMG
jgi:sirohydrochlorin ferrochelatase